MKKNIYVLLLLTGMALTANAQKQYVYLKDGSVIKGKLIFSSNPQTLGIRSSGNIYMFKRSEIDTITTARPMKGAPQALDFRYFFRTALGILPGNSSNEQVAPALFSASFNRQVYKTISAGIGSGMEFYNESTFIPLFANIEYRFRNTRFSPLVFLKTGYLFAATETVTTGGYYPVMPDYYNFIPPGNEPMELEPHGGFMINPGIGMNIMVSNNFGFYLGFGYRYHRIGFDGDNDYSLTYNYNRLSIDIGIIFK